MATDTIVRVDPRTLLVGANVRNEVELGDAFLETLREGGVKIPIVAYESPDGLVVVDGQRRTLGAVKVELEEVPVYIAETPTEAARIVDQVIANEQRMDLTEGDAIAAVQQLALFDVAVPAIVASTGLPEKFVGRAVKVGASAAAKKAMAEHQLSFDYAVMIAAFDEHPEEQAELMKIAAQGREWQVRDRASELLAARAKATIREELEAAGVKVLKEAPSYDSNDPKTLERVFLDKAMKKPLSELTHEKVVELAGDGLRGFPTREWVDGDYVWVAGYAIAGWADRGLFGRIYDYGRSSAEKTPEEAARLKEERRKARENTKAWVEASVPRIQFLQALVAKKTMPKGWEPLVAARMLHNAGSFSTTQLKMILTILKLEGSKDTYSLRAIIQKELAAQPTRAAQIMLAVELGCVEGAQDFDRKGWSFSSTKAYLRQLESWSFTLSDVELVATGRKPRKAPAAA
jgi:ParB family chromosome partitioning protein